MNQDTKHFLEKRIRVLLRDAAQCDDDARSAEALVLDYRTRGAQARTVAGELQALIDGAPVQEVADALGTPGVAGRDVVHVPGAVEAESALPDAVWVPAAVLQPHQHNLVSNVRTNDQGENEYFIQTMFLGDAQKAQAVRNG